MINHENPFPHEPLVCPGILDPAYLGDLVLLVGNLTNKPLSIDPIHLIAFLHIFFVDNIVCAAPCGSHCDLSLSDPAIHIAVPPLNTDLAPSDHAESLSFLEDYANLFPESPTISDS